MSQLHYEFTADDYVESITAWRHQLAKVVRFNPWMKVVWAIGAVGAVLLLTALLERALGDHLSVESMIYAKLGVLVLIFGGLALLAVRHRRVCQRRWADRNRPLFGRMTLDLRDDALVSIGPKARMEFSWDGIEEVSLRDDAVHIYIHAYIMIRIPRSAFPDDAGLRDFLGQIEAHRAAA